MSEERNNIQARLAIEERRFQQGSADDLEANRIMIMNSEQKQNSRRAQPKGQIRIIIMIGEQKKRIIHYIQIVVSCSINEA